MAYAPNIRQPNGRACAVGAVTERDILRRQLHDDIVETLRKRQRPRHPLPQQLFARVAACYVLGRQKTRAPAAVAAETYGNDPDLLRAVGRARHDP